MDCEVVIMDNTSISDNRNKLKILYLRDILVRFSDVEHYITLPQIQKKLEEYGIKATRKTLYDDIELLRIYGMTIALDRKKGYRVLDDRFTAAEIKIMTDEIASSRLLTDENAASLVSKISKLGNAFSDLESSRNIYVSSRPKNANDQVYEIVNVLSKAINEKKIIRFNYFDYTVHKRKKYRDGIYECSPYALTFCDERYYLISFCEKHPSAFTHFRVDRMTNIVITDNPVSELSSDFKIEEYMESSFSMFSGKTESVKLRFTNKFVNAMLDRFGYDTKIRIEDNEHFSVVVDIKTEYPDPFFAWIFKFNGDVEIIEPGHLKEKYISCMRNQLKKLVD